MRRLDGGSGGWLAVRMPGDARHWMVKQGRTSQGPVGFKASLFRIRITVSVPYSSFCKLVACIVKYVL